MGRLLSIQASAEGSSSQGAAAGWQAGPAGGMLRCACIPRLPIHLCMPMAIATRLCHPHMHNPCCPAPASTFCSALTFQQPRASRGAPAVVL